MYCCRKEKFYTCIEIDMTTIQKSTIHYKYTLGTWHVHAQSHTHMHACMRTHTHTHYTLHTHTTHTYTHTHYTHYTHTTHIHTLHTSGLLSLLDIRDTHTMDAAPNTLDVQKEPIRTHKQVHTCTHNTHAIQIHICK